MCVTAGHCLKHSRAALGAPPRGPGNHLLAARKSSARQLGSRHAAMAQKDGAVPISPRTAALRTRQTGPRAPLGAGSPLQGSQLASSSSGAGNHLRELAVTQDGAIEGECTRASQRGGWRQRGGGETLDTRAGRLGGRPRHSPPWPKSRGLSALKAWVNKTVNSASE